MVELFFHPRSPHSQRVIFLLEELKIPYTLRSVLLEKAEHLRAKFSSISPLQRVPVYKDKLLTLSESRAIMRYLAGKRGCFRLWPESSAERAATEQWMEYAGNHLGNHISDLAWEASLAPRYGVKPNNNIAERLRKKLGREMPRLEKHLNKNKWLAGHQMTLADMVLMPHIASLPLAGININKSEAIRQWYEKISPLPSWKKTINICHNEADNRGS